MTIWGWCTMALCATLALSGRNWIVMPLAVGVSGGGVAALIAERAFGIDLWSRMLPASVVLLLVAPPIATFVAAGLAIRGRLVSWRVIVRAGCAWLTLSLILAWRFPALGTSLLGSDGPLDLVSVLPWLAPAMLTLVVLPIPLAPVCVAWNRHR